MSSTSIFRGNRIEPSPELLTRMSMFHIPAEWKEILHTIQGVFPAAMVAGGALRDIILGGDIEDIDIFISAKQCADVNNVPFLPELVDYNFMPFQSDLKNYDMNFCDVVQVYNGRSAETGYKVQLIILQDDVTRQSLADRCDFGICRIVWDGFLVLITDDFIHDYNHKTLTLRKCTYVESHYRRLERFKRRRVFQNWACYAPEIDKFLAEERVVMGKLSPEEF